MEAQRKEPRGGEQMGRDAKDGVGDLPLTLSLKKSKLVGFCVVSSNSSGK